MTRCQKVCMLTECAHGVWTWTCSCPLVEVSGGVIFQHPIPTPRELVPPTHNPILSPTIPTCLERRLQVNRESCREDPQFELGRNKKNSS